MVYGASRLPLKVVGAQDFSGCACSCILTASLLETASVLPATTEIATIDPERYGLAISDHDTLAPIARLDPTCKLLAHKYPAIGGQRPCQICNTGCSNSSQIKAQGEAARHQKVQIIEDCHGRPPRIRIRIASHADNEAATKNVTLQSAKGVHNRSDNDQGIWYLTGTSDSNQNVQVLIDGGSTWWWYNETQCERLAEVAGLAVGHHPRGGAKDRRATAGVW